MAQKSATEYPYYERSLLFPFWSSKKFWDDMYGEVDGPIGILRSLEHSYLGIILLLGTPLLMEKKESERYKITTRGI